jgi:Flp pilus assembly protein TadD
MLSSALLLGVSSVLAVQETQSQSSPTEPTEFFLLLTGSVVMENGSPAPQTVQAELVCNGQILRQDQLDSRGRFEFEIGTPTPKGMTDSSVANFGDVRMISQGQDVLAAGGRSRGRGFSSPSLGRIQLTGCEVRVQSIPGFLTESITLSTRSVFDDPEVGTIVLHPAKNADPTVVSLTTLAAPAEARKAYDQATEELAKEKPDKSVVIEGLERAVKIHPEFALAWNDLALARLASRDVDGAHEAFEKAAKADPRFLSPLLGLTKIEINGGQWEKAAEVTEKMIQLSPEHPECRYLDGMTNYTLNRQKRAKESFSIVKESNYADAFPMTSFFLAMIHIQEGDLESAAAEFRHYLEFVPSGRVPKKLEVWVSNKLVKWEQEGSIKGKN